MPVKVPENRIRPEASTVADLQNGGESFINISSLTVAEDRSLNVFRGSKVCDPEKSKAAVKIARKEDGRYCVDLSGHSEYKFDLQDAPLVRINPNGFIAIDEVIW